MEHIRTEEMKIEHWQCQDRYPAQQLNYRNMLGACMGGEGQPPNLQHCDTKKGNLDFMLNPADASHHIETRLYYMLDGSIQSDNRIINAQLDNVLNLNLPFLKNNRRAKLDAVIFWWKHERDKRHGPVPRESIEHQRQRLIEGSCDFEPYCQVAVWWLDRKLAGKRS
jgi:uncharacterized protein (TIGR02646 family)